MSLQNRTESEYETRRVWLSDKLQFVDGLLQDFETHDKLKFVGLPRGTYDLVQLRLYVYIFRGEVIMTKSSTAKSREIGRPLTRRGRLRCTTVFSDGENTRTAKWERSSDGSKWETFWDVKATKAA